MSKDSTKAPALCAAAIDRRALARRAIAAPGWRWMPGMVGRAHGGQGYTIRIGDQGCESEYPLFYIADGDTLSDCEGLFSWQEHEALPDLTDPATLGCLLALVREKHRCAEAHVYYATLTRQWVVRWGYEGRGTFSVNARTEAEALVAALEEP